MNMKITNGTLNISPYKRISLPGGSLEARFHCIDVSQSVSLSVCLSDDDEGGLGLYPHKFWPLNLCVYKRCSYRWALLYLFKKNIDNYNRNDEYDEKNTIFIRDEVTL